MKTQEQLSLWGFPNMPPVIMPQPENDNSQETDKNKSSTNPLVASSLTERITKIEHEIKSISEKLDYIIELIENGKHTIIDPSMCDHPSIDYSTSKCIICDKTIV